MSSQRVLGQSIFHQCNIFFTYRIGTTLTIEKRRQNRNGGALPSMLNGGIHLHLPALVQPSNCEISYSVEILFKTGCTDDRKI